MEKHIIKIDKEIIHEMQIALAWGKKQSGIDATDTDVQIIGDELQINGDMQTVYAAGLMIGTAIGLLAQSSKNDERC